MGCSCLVGKGGNTRPAATTSARPSSSRCAHCGAGLAVPRPGPGAAVTTVRCALCHRMTRVDRRGGRDLGGGGGGGALEAASSSWAPAEASFLRRDAPSGYPFVPGRKRALLVGVSYKGTSYELEGTVNDVDCMRRLLGESFGFPANSILVLTAGRGRPVEVADEGEPAGGDAVAGGRVRRRRLAGVPLLRPRRAEAGRERRRGGRLQRGALPRGLRAERQDPRRRDQRDHRPAPRRRREAPRHRGHVPQRHHPGPPLPLPPLPDGLLAVGEPLPPPGARQGHQRRPRHLHQRLQRRSEIRRQQRGGGGGDRGDDVQLHQGGGVGARDDVRAAAGGDAGDDPGGAAGERRPAAPPRPPRLLRPQDDPVRRRAGAAALRVGGVRHLQEAVSPVTKRFSLFPPRIRFYRALNLSAFIHLPASEIL
ncbi:hypothetical protein EE612_017802 [Oryza sativa]|nr:hypothetical protein EE612_017802 [Oryza sativa]